MKVRGLRSHIALRCIIQLVSDKSLIFHDRRERRSDQR